MGCHFLLHPIQRYPLIKNYCLSSFCLSNLDSHPNSALLRQCKPHAKSWLIGKDSDAGRDWGQLEKGMTEDEMAGWHHQLDGLESQWTPGVGDGQGGLACCNSWGCKESDMTERLIWFDLIWWSTKRTQSEHCIQKLLYYFFLGSYIINLTYS